MLLVVVVWQIYTPVFIAVIAFFSVVAAYEIMKCARIKNRFLLYGGMLLALIIPLFSQASILEPVISTQYWSDVINFVPKSVYLILIVIFFFISMLVDYENTKFEDVAISIVASILVPYGFSVFGKLRDINGYKTQFGIYLVFFALICALGTDVGAQLGGMKFGKTKLSPKISPKKTVEGAVCGIIASIILNAVALTLYNYLAKVPLTNKQITAVMIMVPIISVFGMLGDLTASVLKRNFDTKDFGNIFPGHGGVMDRFDSTLFTIPLTYAFTMLVLN